MLPQEEQCPVEESLLGKLYRSSPAALHELVDTIPSQSRCRLALYCYRRAHLSDLALAIASTCDHDTLVDVGGELGRVMYLQSRNPPPAIQTRRSKISLSSAATFSRIVAQDLI